MNYLGVWELTKLLKPLHNYSENLQCDSEEPRPKVGASWRSYRSL